MKRSTLLAAVAGLALSGSVWAASHAQFGMAVKARQGLMAVNGMSMGVLGGMAQGKIAYDATAAQAAADNIANVASMNMADFWPAGSDNASIEGTKALPAIWAEGSGIGAELAAFKAAADGMQAAAGTGLEGLQAAMGPLGGTCGSCHKAFRASE